MTWEKKRLHAQPMAWISRLVDIVIAAAGLVFLSPLILVISIAIVAETGRPILFSQERLGKGGRHFRIYKFRKFRPEFDKPSLPLTELNDRRTSRVGRLLARTKLDELPQLYNVLKGDMAVVGPRPETLDFADCFSGDFRAVLDYTPGLFGPCQVAFRNEASLYPANADLVSFYRESIFPLKAALDLSYYPNRTLPRDLLWVARGTLAVVGFHPTPVLLSPPPPQPPAGNRAVTVAVGPPGLLSRGYSRRLQRSKPASIPTGTG